MTDFLPTSTPPASTDSVTVPLRRSITTLNAETPGAMTDKLVISDVNALAGRWTELDAKDGVEAEILALSLMTDILPRDIGALTLRDFRAGQRAMGAYLAAAEVMVADDETSRTLTLLRPIDVPGGAPITEIQLREPLASDLDKWDSLQGVAKDLAAVTTITGLPPLSARLMHVRDFRAAAGWIAHFFDDALPAGA